MLIAVFCSITTQTPYGIKVKQPDGSYIFYLLDAKGQELVKELLKTTKKENNITIQGKFVEGVLSNKVLKVLELNEIK